jgi:hypothetical protein
VEPKVLGETADPLLLLLSIVVTTSELATPPPHTPPAKLYHMNHAMCIIIISNQKNDLSICKNKSN